MRIGRGSLLAIVLGLWAGGLLGAEPEATGDYLIGPRDLLEVRVLEVPELNVERRVSDSGTIDLPLLGEFSVSGQPAHEVQTRLENLLVSKYVNRANVSVVIKEYTNKPISVVGAVRTPGSLRVSGRWTLLQAITAAGGLTETAGRKIFVLRQDKGEAKTVEVGVEELFSSSAQSNITLFPGDVVNIPAVRTVRLYFLGEFKSPGAIDFRSDDRITLLSAVAKAGGLTDRASNTIRIKRHGADGKDTETVVSFKRVLAGKEPDPILQPDDVLVVKESFF